MATKSRIIIAFVGLFLAIISALPVSIYGEEIEQFGLYVRIISITDPNENSIKALRETARSVNEHIAEKSQARASIHDVVDPEDAIPRRKTTSVIIGPFKAVPNNDRTISAIIAGKKCKDVDIDALLTANDEKFAKDKAELLKGIIKTYVNSDFILVPIKTSVE